jgi:hypothetical protein
VWGRYVSIPSKVALIPKSYPDSEMMLAYASCMAWDVLLEIKPYKILSDDIFLPKPYVVYIRKPHTYAACNYIELCQIVVTLATRFSCFSDQDHVHSTFTC